MRGGLPLKADHIMDVKIKMFTCDGMEGCGGQIKLRQGCGGGWVGLSKKSIKVTVFICLCEVISSSCCKTLCSFQRFNHGRDHNPSRRPVDSHDATRIIMELRFTCL